MESKHTPGNERISHYDNPIFKDVVVIYFPWWAGGVNGRFWVSEMNGDVLDYQTKSFLIQVQKDRKRKYAVIRYHKKTEKGFSVLEKNF